MSNDGLLPHDNQDNDVDSLGRNRDSYILDTMEPYPDLVKREAFLALEQEGWNYPKAHKLLIKRFGPGNEEGNEPWVAIPSDRTLRRWAASHEKHILGNVLFPEAMRHQHEVLTKTKTSDNLPVTVKDRNIVASQVIEQQRGKPKQRLEGNILHGHLDFSELMDLATNPTPPVKENSPDGEKVKPLDSVWYPADDVKSDSKGSEKPS